MEIGYFYDYILIMRNKTILSIALACITGLTASAQISGDGYYRIKNATTERYMSLSDNTSRGLNYQTTTVDASALLTKKNWDEVSTDPGTIFYIEHKNNDEYNIKSQGADMYNMIKYYIRLKYYANGNVYRAWQSETGGTVYLSDENDVFKDEDISYVDNNNMSTVNWYIMEVNTTDNYIAVKPTFSANGKYYASFFAAFPFSVTSSNMKVYYINNIDENKGEASYKEITGIVPASTPVIIECSSQEATENKLKVEATNPTAFKDNKMVGVYFCLGSRDIAHYNSTKFEASSMRTLAVAEDGSLILNDEDTNMTSTLIRIGTKRPYTYETIKAIPHNTGYLKVSASCPKTLKLVDATTGIKDITLDDDNKPANVYNVNGMIVRKNATDVKGLPQGVYIFKNKKYVIK